MTLSDDGTITEIVTMRSRLAAREAAWVAGHAGVGACSTCTSVGERERLIRELAYLRAERRGFMPGHEVEDWLEAERELEHASQSSLLV